MKKCNNKLKTNKKEIIVLEYSGWDTIKDRSENPILWWTECKPENLVEKFNEFIKWDKNGANKGKNSLLHFCLI